MSPLVPCHEPAAARAASWGLDVPDGVQIIGMSATLSNAHEASAAGAQVEAQVEAREDPREEP